MASTEWSPTVHSSAHQNGSVPSYGEGVSRWIEGVPVNDAVTWVPLNRVVKMVASPVPPLVEEPPGAHYLVSATLDYGAEDVWLGRFPTLEEAAHYVRARLPAWPTVKPV